MLHRHIEIPALLSFRRFDSLIKKPINLIGSSNKPIDSIGSSNKPIDLIKPYIQLLNDDHND